MCFICADEVCGIDFASLSEYFVDFFQSFEILAAVYHVYVEYRQNISYDSPSCSFNAASFTLNEQRFYLSSKLRF